MTRNNSSRAGFTLIELLTVLAILGILVALSAAAVMRVRISQQARSSSDVVGKVQVAVDNQYKVIIDQVKKERLSKSSDFANMATYSADDDMAETLLAYGRVRQFFPQTFAEVTANGFSIGPVAFPLKSQFTPFLNATDATNNFSGQSALLLYVAVSATGAGGSVFDSDGATASASNDFTVGSVTARAYKDAFQSPIGFCRFGTNAELQSNSKYFNPKYPVKDPFDPTGKLTTWATTAANKNTATTWAKWVFVNNGDAANANWFDGSNRIPVVYSNGLNKLYESLDNNPLTSSYPPKDDILGYRLRQIGQRGTQ